MNCRQDDATQASGQAESKSLPAEERRDFERLTRRIRRGLRKLGAYDPALDSPLVEEVADSAIWIKRGKRYLGDPNCPAETYTAVSDAMAKHASRMRDAIKQLAASRSDRLRFQPVTGLAGEIMRLVDKVIREG